jgi:hypothetical protein
VVQQAYVCGVSTRRVDQLVESLGLRISKSEVSRICGALDEHVEAFRTRPLEGRYPYLFLDAKVEKVRDGGRVVNKALVIAHGVDETGRREILGPRRRRGRDRGILGRLSQSPGLARPGRRPRRRSAVPIGPQQDEVMPGEVPPRHRRWRHVVVVGYLARPLPARAATPPRAARICASALRRVAPDIAGQAAAMKDALTRN